MVEEKGRCILDQVLMDRLLHMLEGTRRAPMGPHQHMGTSCTGSQATMECLPIHMGHMPHTNLRPQLTVHTLVGPMAPAAQLTAGVHRTEWPFPTQTADVSCGAVT